MKSEKNSLKNNSSFFFFNFKLELFIFLNNKKSNPKISDISFQSLDSVIVLFQEQSVSFQSKSVQELMTDT